MNEVFYYIPENLISYGNQNYVLEENKLTRDRIMSKRDLIAYVLCNMGKTTALQAEMFLEVKNGDDSVKISRQAISQRRVFLDPVIYKDINRDCLIEAYSKNKEDFSYFKGYLLLATDGSKFEIPNTPQTREAFSVPSNTLVYTQPPRAQVSGLYDLLNGYMIDSSIGNIEIGERKLAIEHINNAKEIVDLTQAILIYDRGYPSIEMFMTVMEQNSNFIFRLPKKFYDKEREKMKSDDEIVKISLTGARTRDIENEQLKEKINKKTHLKLRIVNIELENGKTESLITNLSKKKMSKQELKELYNKRWGIETNYNLLKNRLEIENFSGHKKVIIEQDFYAQILVSNILNETRLITNEELKKDKESEYEEMEYKPNMNVLAGKLKMKLPHMVLTNDLEERKKIMESIINTGKRNLIPVKKKKSSPRIKKTRTNKNPHNNRPNH